MTIELYYHMNLQSEDGPIAKDGVKKKGLTANGKVHKKGSNSDED